MTAFLKRGSISAALLLGMVAVTSLGASGAAEAATSTSASIKTAVAADSDCVAWEACIYYNSSDYGWGAYLITSGDTERANFYGISDYAGYTFKAGVHGSAGAGQPVKNNASGVANHYPSTGTIRIYFNSGYSCAIDCQDIGGGQSVNLKASMKNQNASGRIIS